MTERASASPIRRLRALDVDADADVDAGPAAASFPAEALPEGLRDVQTWMMTAITAMSPDSAREAALLTDGRALSAHQRFEIYRYGYRARLVECLLDDYPVLAMTLGEAAFETLCHTYVERHPSRSPNLNAFGRHMANVCKEAAPAGFGAASDFLAELATLEWCITEMIHAPASAPFDFASLATLPIEAWGGARLVASQTVRVLAFTHPVNAYFQKRRRGGDADIPPAGASATVIYRKDWTIWRMELTPAMMRVLTALLEGTPIAEALERMGVDESDPAALGEAERSVMVWFRAWVEAGFFCGIRLDS
jgi:hypothetical protein